jgi:phospholipid-binding lipoprotein MlaA
MSRAGRAANLALGLLSLAGCASVPREPAARAEFKANNDPLEPLNRRVFQVNLAVDRVLIKPLAQGYRRALPQPVRDALRHFLDNLEEPLVMANCILQGRFKATGITAGRFAVNTTFGVVGLSDAAVAWKLPRQVGDFGQTLWAWGAGEGPYLIVPVFGPLTPRDGIGQGVDILFDPLRFVVRNQDIPSGVTAGRVVVDGLDQRARSLDTLDEIQRESIDYYASLRSLYRQNRAAQLQGAKAATTLPPADFYDDSGR